MDERGVRFLTKDGHSECLPPNEFIRRFLQHVLPSGFVKIRHYGLLPPANVNTKLPIALRLMSPPPASPPVETLGHGQRRAPCILHRCAGRPFPSAS